MKTLYLKDGTEIKRDGIDAKDYVRAGLATYEKPEIVQEIVIDASTDKEQVVEQVHQSIHKKRGPKPKGDKDGMQEEK